jgi:tetratricopeptide (TPR) repeat protein
VDLSLTRVCHVSRNSRTAVTVLVLQILALGALFLSWVVPARAVDLESPAYTDAINLGIAEFEERNFAEARTHFGRAHALYPNARTLRALGMAEFELKNYGESIQYLEQALASNEKPLAGQLREEAQNLLDRAKGYVARLSVSVDPGAASVVVDGVPVQLGTSGVLVLEVGDHVLEFRAPGRIGEKRELKIQGGEQDTLRVVLPALEAQSRQEKAKRPLYKSPWLWTAVGVVVAGAAAGTAVALGGGGTTTKTEEPYTGNGGAAVLAAP